MDEEKREKVSCIGEPKGQVRVYLEETCAAYLRENEESALGGFQLFGLMGKEYRLGDETFFLIRGALENQEDGARQMRLSRETVRELEEEGGRQFPGLRLVGWAVNQPGYGTEGAWRFAGLRERFFADVPLFLLMDGSEEKMAFYGWEEGRDEELGGYHIYTDEEARSAPRPMSERLREEAEREREPLLWDPLPEAARPDGPAAKKSEPERRPAGKGREEARENGQSMRMLTSLASVLLRVCLVMGMLLFNNVNTLDGIQEKLDTLDQQIEQIHTGMFGTENQD